MDSSMGECRADTLTPKVGTELDFYAYDMERIIWIIGQHDA